MSRRGSHPREDRSGKVELAEAIRAVQAMPLLRRLHSSTSGRVAKRGAPGWREVPNGWFLAEGNGALQLRYAPRRPVREWQGAMAHALLHYGLGHLDADPHRAIEAGGPRPIWNLACCAEVERVAKQFGLPPQPAELQLGIELPGRDLEAFREALRHHGRLEELLAGFVPDLAPDAARSAHWRSHEWPARLGDGLRDAVRVSLAGAQAPREAPGEELPWAIEQARSWLIAHVPLLAGLAASFRHVADPDALTRMGIEVAAIDPSLKEVYCNPRAGLSTEEWCFVLAHQYLHAGLRHPQRRDGRDAFLWNVATDYAVNGWLQEMGVGTVPRGVLLDPELRGLSAEEIYDRLEPELRRIRRSTTFAGRGKPDMLGAAAEEWWLRGGGMTLDDLYRHALANALPEHEARGRGTLPAGLIEEIHAQAQPPIPWEVELARWLDGQIPPPETRRSYARASRRQSATPDIPRPVTIPPPADTDARTFGVVLDTSGSMQRPLLARALGAIASYATSREVQLVRVVFCDAHPFDAGWMSPEEIAGKVRVRGRGGTVLQPGVDLLEAAQDFPRDGPLLIITDTYCDHVRPKREHAYLVPAGSRLPFHAKGPVFGLRAG